jgi:hypothetical protein
VDYYFDFQAVDQNLTLGAKQEIVEDWSAGV